MTTEEQLKKALIQAHNAGDIEAANLFASKIKQMQTQQPSPLPQEDEEPVQKPSLDGLSASAITKTPKTLLGGLENIASMATSIPTGALASLTELGAASAEELGVDSSGAREFAREVRGSAYQPQTEAGKNIQKGIAQVLEPAGDFFNKYVLAPSVAGLPTIDPKNAGELFRDIEDRGIEAVADRIERETGSPLLTEITRKSGDIYGTVLGAKPLWNKMTKSPRLAKQVMAEQIKSGNPNTAVVGKMLDDNGVIKTNRVTTRAKNTLAKVVGDDVARDTVTVMEVMNDTNKKGVNKMLDIVKEIRRNPLAAQDMRPSDILGDSLAYRARQIARINKTASKTIGGIAEKLSKDGVSVNISNPARKFLDNLDSMGVRLSKGDDGWITADISRSKFVGGDQRMLNVLINDLAKGNLDFKSAHELKRQIRDNVDFGAATGNQVKGRSQSILKELASDINEELKGKSEAYDRANKKFSSTIEAYEALDKLAGKDIDLFSDLAPEALAGKAMRIISNATTKTPIKKVIYDVENALKQNGVNLKDDISGLIHMADDIESAFKATPKRSLGGIMERTGANIAQGSSAPVEGVRGIYDAIKSLSEPDYEKLMKAYRDLAKVKNNG